MNASSAVISVVGIDLVRSSPCPLISKNSLIAVSIP
jgi:hypothetical protein